MKKPFILILGHFLGKNDLHHYRPGDIATWAKLSKFDKSKIIIVNTLFSISYVSVIVTATKRVFPDLLNRPKKTLSLCQNNVQANMALLNKRLTPAEIAAIHYHVFGNCSDWIQLYAIADNLPDADNINRSTVYKWKNSAKIVDLIRDLQRHKQDLIDDALTKERNEDRQTDTKIDRDRVRTENAPKNGRPQFIDFSRPENQTAKLNELVNTASDPGEALDALKVIIQGQRADRDAAKEGRIVRAYLPVSCTDCPLYEKARKKVTI